MVDGEPAEGANVGTGRPGETLRDARVAQGLDLADVAARTRIPQRHLESIESGSYGNLPSSTYAIGFAKAYARAVGVDEVALTQRVRGELAVAPVYAAPTPHYEFDDPTRVPSRGLVFGGAIVALLVVIGIGLFYGTNLFRSGGASGSAAPTAAEAPAPAVPVASTPAPVASGQVSLTATDEVWVRIYDKAGTTLLMKAMAPGERYDVPASAEGPMINTGRPDKLAVTVNGSTVPALGDGRLAIKDVPIDAAALLARPATGETAQPPSARATMVVPPAGNATAPE